MAAGVKSISPEGFRAAQKAERMNWDDEACNAARIRHEMEEHSEVQVPLKNCVGEEQFVRGLEVGIGPYSLGFLAVHFAGHVQSLDGLDPLERIDISLDDKGLQVCVDQIRHRVNYIRAQGESIPAENCTYDLVSCINVVDHAQNPYEIMSEIDRVLKPGGVLVFGVNTLSWAGEWQWRLLRARKPDEWLFVAHPHTFQWRKATRMVKTVEGGLLWSNKPNMRERFIGHGRMSFWIIRKALA